MTGTVEGHLTVTKRWERIGRRLRHDHVSLVGAVTRFTKWSLKTTGVCVDRILVVMNFRKWLKTKGHSSGVQKTAAVPCSWLEYFTDRYAISQYSTDNDSADSECARGIQLIIVNSIHRVKARISCKGHLSRLLILLWEWIKISVLYKLTYNVVLYYS